MFGSYEKRIVYVKQNLLLGRKTRVGNPKQQGL